MKEILGLSGPPCALSALQCSVAAGAPQGKWAVFHGEGGMHSLPRVNPEALESSSGCKAVEVKPWAGNGQKRQVLLLVLIQQCLALSGHVGLLALQLLTWIIPVLEAPFEQQTLP